MVMYEPKDCKSVIIFTGNFGSGKTEVAVNFSLELARLGKKASIADLDIVNPYFRSREAVEVLEKNGVKVLTTPSEYFHADLPGVIPEFKGIIQKPNDYSVLDLGGDDLGAKILSYLEDAFSPNNYDFFMVVNTSRPFTSDLAGLLKMKSEIEQASKLKITALVVNTHLMELTSMETVLHGIEIAEQFATECDLPIKFVAIMGEVLDRFEPDTIDYPVFRLERYLLPPFKKRQYKSPLYYLES